MNYIEIQKLIKKGDIKKAQQELKDKPFSQTQTSIYRKTEKLLSKKIQNLRKKFVQQSIKKCKDYLKEGELDKAYHLILDLENIDSSNSKIQRLKTKIITSINRSLRDSAKTLFKKSQIEIENLIKSNQPQKALEVTYQLTQLPETLRKQLEIETKRKIIDNKLKSNKKSLSKTPAPQKYDFIKNLFDLEPTYPKIQKILISCKEELREYSKHQKKNLLEELTRETKILFNKKEYSKAKENAKRILSIDPTNSKGIKYYKKSEHCYYNDSYSKAYQILQSKTKI